MATMADISAAINQIEINKQNLQQSFIHLQSQTPSSFNLPLNWTDLDSYFTTLLTSLRSKFNLLQSFSPHSNATTVPARPELKSLCENSDSLGLVQYIALASERSSVLNELTDAYRYAPDAAAMVLDAMVGFYSPDWQESELVSFRDGCLIMLEGLIRLKPDVTMELKDKAMEIAVQWNQKRCFCPCEQKALGFLLLVGAYGLLDRFDIEEITDCFLVVAANRHVIDLFRRIVPENKINYMIQKLIDKNMIVTAVKFSIELQKTDEFSPVGLLEELKLKAMIVMEKKRRNAKYRDVWRGVTIEGISTLKSIIKCIDENQLELEYPKDGVIELVNKLENELKNCKHVKGLLRKKPLRVTLLHQQLLSESKKSKKSKKRKVNNAQTTAEPAAVTPLQSVKLIEEPNSQKSDLSPDHNIECHVSPHGLRPTGFKTPYTSLSDSRHGSTRADTGFNFYASELLPVSVCGSNGWISD
ncbi:hypothetical protein QVD17_06064 [Tagetes erecta]|uniref:FRIGIDA-like protein n=1 Tax=Tagetes erecta TaxID=13708 RepID=A0AAD8PBK2_TARER|nr:hypothetical protein QVD17_06064 [Tagetes erecta]